MGDLDRLLGLELPEAMTTLMDLDVDFEVVHLPRPKSRLHLDFSGPERVVRVRRDHRGGVLLEVAELPTPSGDVRDCLMRRSGDPIR